MLSDGTVEKNVFQLNKLNEGCKCFKCLSMYGKLNGVDSCKVLEFKFTFRENFISFHKDQEHFEPRTSISARTSLNDGSAR